MDDGDMLPTHPHDDSPGSVQPFGLPTDAALTYSGLSRSRLYRAAQDGLVTAVKDGKKTIWVFASLKAFVENLPPAAFHAKAGSHE